jgi:type II secretory pathway component GspD/PulD (secretin)
MRMSLYSCALVAVLLVPLASRAAGPGVAVPAGGSIKLEFTNAPLSHVLERFSARAEMNFILPESYANQRITILSAKPVTFREAFQALEAALDVERLVVRPVGKFALITRKPHKRQKGVANRD